MTDQAIPAWAVPGARVVFVNDRLPAGPTKTPEYDPEIGEVCTLGAFYGFRAGGVGRFHIIGKPRWLIWPVTNFRPAVEPKSEARDVALFEDIIRGMSLVDRLDRLAEVLNA